jgi:hypothetical protein
MTRSGAAALRNRMGASIFAVRLDALAVDLKAGA